MVHGIGRRPLKPWMYFEYPEFKALHSSRDILGLSQAVAPLNTKYPRILGTFRDCSSFGRLHLYILDMKLEIISTHVPHLALP